MLISARTLPEASLKEKVLCTAILTGKAIQIGFGTGNGTLMEKTEIETGVFNEHEQENPADSL